MNRIFNILFLSLLLLVAGTFSVSAQIINEQGQYVDTIFHDNVDRTAEDFVTVSLMISQPSDVRVYSIFGHAALRLQCPTFGLDYVFSYISIYSDASALDYIVIRPTMGLIVIPTAQYIEDEFRGTREYKMYLPPKVEIELWRILDENAAKGYNRPYDCVAGSCAQMVYQYVMRAVAAVDMEDGVYIQWLGEPEHTMHELMNVYAQEAPWQLFLINSILGSSYVDNVKMSNARKVLFPEQLVALWHKTTLLGKPILSKDAKVHTTSETMKAPPLSPICVAIVLLLLALCSVALMFGEKMLWTTKVGNGIDYLLLGLQTLAGIFMIVMMWVAYLPFPQSYWNWLLIPFNVLPIIFWHWRKFWVLPYALVLVVWCVIMVSMNLWAHMLVEWSHIVLLTAWIIILLKQYILIKKNKKTK